MRFLIILATITIQYETNGRQLDNWTTCDEFGVDTVFHPRLVVHNDWVPFYMWSLEWVIGIFIHQFSYPKFDLVKMYKNEMVSVLNGTFDTRGAKLCMTSDIANLLISTGSKGEFDAIPYAFVPSSMKLVKLKFPILRFRLKMVGQYLALMMCDHKFATIMAVSGTEPNTADKIQSQAALLNFRGSGYPIYRDAIRQPFEKICKI